MYNKMPLIILCVLFCYQVMPQSIGKSILVEVPLIKTESFSQEYTNLQLTNEYYRKGTTSGIGIYYSWRFPFIFTSLLEIRPGLFISDPDFMGIDLGFYLRQNLYKNLFTIIGSNIHYNFGFSEGQLAWKRSSLGGVYFSPGASFGYTFSQKISIFLGYYVLLKNNWRESWLVNYRESYYSKSTEKMYWMFKCGIELNQ